MDSGIHCNTVHTTIFSILIIIIIVSRFNLSSHVNFLLIKDILGISWITYFITISKIHHIHINSHHPLLTSHLPCKYPSLTSPPPPYKFPSPTHSSSNGFANSTFNISKSAQRLLHLKTALQYLLSPFINLSQLLIQQSLRLQQFIIQL